MLGRSLTCWNVRAMPMPRDFHLRTLRDVLARGNWMRPALACSAPVSRLNIVLLPAPFGPIRPRISPALRSKLTLLTAVSPPKVLTAFSTFRIRVPPSGSARRGIASAAAGGGRVSLGQALGDEGNEAAARVLQQQDQGER